uniref:G-protein coupled receptors family 1 profile domain-containing protein n=1 Tax=Astyanax mexicanus TaxID=7994 RepID=A0A3B1JY54_ASTMX
SSRARERHRERERFACSDVSYSQVKVLFYLLVLILVQFIILQIFDLWVLYLFLSDSCSSCILFLHLHVKDGGHCSTVDVDHNNFIRGFTFASVLSVLTCCFLVYWRLQSWYRRYEQAGLFTDSQRCTGRIWSSARYMIVVIIFCWTPALVLISFSFATPESNRLFPLFVVQAVTVSLQGFLNSIVYGWRRRNFREAVLGERLPLMAYANRAFFEQSLSDAQQ